MGAALLAPTCDFHLVDSNKVSLDNARSRAEAAGAMRSLKLLLERDRLQYAVESGIYKAAAIAKMVPLEASPKNDIITAVRSET